MEEKLKRSRKLREWNPNVMYHVSSRVNRQSDIFREFKRSTRLRKQRWKDIRMSISG